MSRGKFFNSFSPKMTKHWKVILWLGYVTPGRPSVSGIGYCGWDSLSKLREAEKRGGRRRGEATVERGAAAVRPPRPPPHHHHHDCRQLRWLAIVASPPCDARLQTCSLKLGLCISGTLFWERNGFFRASGRVARIANAIKCNTLTVNHFHHGHNLNFLT